MNKMPCHISDGPQTPEDVPEYIEQDGDAIHDELRQQEVDDLARKRRITELNESLKDITLSQGFLTKLQAD